MIQFLRQLLERISFLLLRITDSYRAINFVFSKNDSIILVADIPSSRKMRFLNLYDSRKGPPAVLFNLRTALLRCKVPHTIIFTSELFDDSNLLNYSMSERFILVPGWTRSQFELEELIKHSSGSKILIGPNISLTHNEINSITTRSKNEIYFIVPSNEIKRFFESKFSENELLLRRTIVVPSPVDSQYWSPGGNQKNKILLYLKHRVGIQDIVIMNYLRERFGERVELIEYGKYSPIKLRTAGRHSKFCVYLASTESQGIALLEMWSMDIPTFVRVPNNFEIEKGREVSRYGATPETYAPYLKPNAGSFFSDVDELQNLIDDLEKKEIEYSPRKWAFENFNMTAYVENLLSLSHQNPKSSL